MTSRHLQEVTSTGIPLTPFHNAMLEVATRIVDGELARDVWDEDPPTVWAIDKSKRTPLGMMMTLTAWEVPVPEEMWQDRQGADVVVRLSEVMRETIQASRHPPQWNVCGIALTGEAWTMKFPDDATPEQREAAQLFAAKRGIADHPWGVEAKTAIAVGTDGWRYNVLRQRNTGDGSQFAEPRDGGIGGNYPVALEMLLDAMLSGQQ